MGGVVGGNNEFDFGGDRSSVDFARIRIIFTPVANKSDFVVGEKFWGEVGLKEEAQGEY